MGAVAARAAGQGPGRLSAAAFGSMLGGWLLGAVTRRVSTRTGVSDAEAYGSLPGDDLIAHPMVEWTRGITVGTTAVRVWPWLAQMGYGRGGWYTPQWVDLFANRWVFGHKTRFPASADRLLPEYQHVAVGDIVCDGPNYASYFRVQHVDPPHALVYRSIRHPRRGSPIDINDPESPSKIEQQLRESGTYLDFTWALVLCELPRDRTRLLVRTRANYSPPAFRLLSLPLGLVDATYGVAMLRAIARRAEAVDLLSS
jgi:hypothetical protein